MQFVRLGGVTVPKESRFSPVTALAVTLSESCWSYACVRAQRPTMRGSPMLLDRVVSGGCWRGDKAVRQARGSRRPAALWPRSWAWPGDSSGMRAGKPHAARGRGVIARRWRDGTASLPAPGAAWNPASCAPCRRRPTTARPNIFSYMLIPARRTMRASALLLGRIASGGCGRADPDVRMLRQKGSLCSGTGGKGQKGALLARRYSTTASCPAEAGDGNRAQRLKPEYQGASHLTHRTKSQSAPTPRAVKQPRAANIRSVLNPIYE